MRISRVSALLIMVLVLAIYWPGLTGGFVFDDYQNFVLNQAVHLDELTLSGLARATQSSGAGPTGRPVAQITFALNYWFGGLNPWGYKFISVLIHAVNSLLVLLLVVLVARLYDPKLSSKTAGYFGLAVALLWALHPLNVSTVLYVVQRMTLLAGTFTLLTLICYVRFREQLSSLRMSGIVLWLLGLFVLMVCGIYAKETAILIPLYVLSIEYIAFGFVCENKRRQTIIRGFFFSLILVPALWFVGTTLLDPRWVARMHDGRGYLFSDYLLSQARVLWFYLRSIFIPNISELGLYHDDYVMSDSIFSPPSTLLAVLGHMALICTAWLVRHRYRVLTFGVAWFYFGHALESTIFPLLLVFEHRNYLPSLGPLLIVVWAICQVRISEKAKFVVCGFCILVMAALTMVRAEEWGDFIGFSLRQAEKHPASVRANFDAGRTLSMLVIKHPELSPEYAPLAIKYFERAADAPLKLPEPYMAVFQLASYADIEVPAGFFERLQTVLASERPPINVFYLFSGLRGLYLNERHPLTVEQGVALFESARTNPRLEGLSRGHMLANYALFLREQGLDNKKAQLLAEEAVTLAPGFLDNRILAGWLSYENGDMERAKSYLLAVEVLDKFGVFATEIKELRATLYPAK